jgi:hypothetical protein
MIYKGNLKKIELPNIDDLYRRNSDKLEKELVAI